jgi:rod shape-determining protein MreB
MNFPFLKKFLTSSMAIDMGSANTIIAVKGRGVVVDEPSLVAINELNNEIVAFGHDASEIWGREGRDVVVKAPLSSGVVADFELTKKMLSHFVKKSVTSSSRISVQAVMSLLSDATHVEQKALLNAAEDAHIGKVYMMEEGLAAAFGAGVDPRDKKASAVVDIGSGTTNVAIVAKGTVVHSKSVRLGSAEINTALATHLRRHRGIMIGNETSESVKLNFVSVIEPKDDDRELMIAGRDIQTGSPTAVKVTASEIYPVVEGVVQRIAQIVKETFAELSPEIAADIYSRGFILTGGASLLDGMDKYFRDYVDLAVTIPEEPRYATVHGLLSMFDEPELLERVSRNELHILQNAEVPFEA